VYELFPELDKLEHQFQSPNNQVKRDLRQAEWELIKRIEARCIALEDRLKSRVEFADIVIIEFKEFKATIEQKIELIMHMIEEQGKQIDHMTKHIEDLNGSIRGWNSEPGILTRVSGLEGWLGLFKVVLTGIGVLTVGLIGKLVYDFIQGK